MQLRHPGLGLQLHASTLLPGLTFAKMDRTPSSIASPPIHWDLPHNGGVHLSARYYAQPTTRVRTSYARWEHIPSKCLSEAKATGRLDFCR